MTENNASHQNTIISFCEISASICVLDYCKCNMLSTTSMRMIHLYKPTSVGEIAFFANASWLAKNSLCPSGACNFVSNLILITLTLNCSSASRLFFLFPMFVVYSPCVLFCNDYNVYFNWMNARQGNKMSEINNSSGEAVSWPKHANPIYYSQSTPN